MFKRVVFFVFLPILLLMVASSLGFGLITGFASFGETFGVGVIFLFFAFKGLLALIIMAVLGAWAFPDEKYDGDSFEMEFNEDDEV